MVNNEGKKSISNSDDLEKEVEQEILLENAALILDYPGLRRFENVPDYIQFLNDLLNSFEK
jgi:hypothetical protein